jgi:glutathione synthase/RimK-type ligase-like ATP-grasp enzyme
MKIAFICYQSGEKFSAIEEENNLLLQYLQQKGLDIQKEIWNDPKVDWAAYDLAVLKAPWDYFDKYEEFVNWLNKLEQLNVRLLNPVQTVQWNSDKHYLQEIAEAGLEVIPTIFIEKGEQPELTDYFEKLNSEQIIIKPAVSGGAKNTFALKREDIEAAKANIYELLQSEAFMAQPFIEQIKEEGEWSLVFFNGKFSHCLLKKAKSGDFRVQHVHGGSVHPMPASEEMLHIAQQYVDKFAQGCLYARVDGVMIDGTFSLMELELIEPFLYLDSSQNGFENYFEALQKMMKKELV